MQTSQPDRIIRQKNPELLKAVKHLASNETAEGISMLSRQGRVTEIPNGQDRIAAIAKVYAAQPENTIIVFPDNVSRRAINQTVRQLLQTTGALDRQDHAVRVLAQRSDLIGADRVWAARYQVDDVLYYIRGSKEHDIQVGGYAHVAAINAKANLITVRKQDVEQVTYDPRRLRGISAYSEIEREFAVGDAQALEWQLV